MTETQQLLKAYVKDKSDSAFQELVARYLNLVYSAAMRLLNGDAHAAQDVTQTVFLELARKARTFPSDIQLGGWLYRTACFAASNHRRGEQRRMAREQKAVEMNMLHDDSDHSWRQLSPHLDDALTKLTAEDRDAIVLRFFERQDFRAIGAALGIADTTAQKRVSRALDKLRGLFAEQGVRLSVAVLTGLLATHAVLAAPPNLVQTVASTVLQTVPKSKKLLATKAIIGGVGAFLVFVSFVAVQQSWLGNKGDGNFTTDAGNANVFHQTPAAKNPGSVSDVNSKGADGETKTINSKLAGNEPTNVLHLEILADDSGRRLANVPMEVVIEGKEYSRNKQVSDRLGNLHLPLPSRIEKLQITTQLENFADTRLLWEPSHGEIIPTNYVLRLQRPVKIGGRVEDEKGAPIAGAHISFGAEVDIYSDKRPESHEFGWIATTSDTKGRWEINRLASDMIRRLSGDAHHSNYVSVYLDVAELSSAEEALREQRYVFHLTGGVTLRGTVLDDEGRPLSGAAVYIGSVGDVARRKVFTDSNGKFALPGCRSGKEMFRKFQDEERNLPPFKDVVTAVATGFASRTVETTVEDDTAPLRIQLERPKTVRLRVVNERKEPVCDAWISLNTHGYNFGLGEKDKPIVPQVEFSYTTGTNGTVVWASAPSGELVFQVMADGYQTVGKVPVPADGQEHEVTLKKAARPLIISGTVKDANGRPIPRFRLILGWPETVNTNVIWSDLERHWLTFAGGVYRYEADEPLVMGMPDPGYVLKFEADGYVNSVSRTVAPDEGDVKLDVYMKPSPTLVVPVLLPNGDPAVGADVGLVTKASELRLIPGGFDRARNQSVGYLLRTDERGTFKWQPDDAVQRIMVAHQAGFGEASPEQLAAALPIQLAPWGRLEGTYFSGGKPVQGRQLLIELTNQNFLSVSYDLERRVRTDADGKFVFEKLPAGKHQLVRVAPETREGTTSYPMIPLQDVEIVSGQTKTVRVGDATSTVTVRIRFEGVSFPAKSHTFAVIGSRRDFPPGVPNDEASMRAYLETEEGKAFEKTLVSSRFEQRPDGSWSAERLPPGNYEMVVRVYDLTDLSGEGELPVVARGEAKLVIPEATLEHPNGETIDAGVIVVKPLVEASSQK
jgi:RNA polymerase sigma factor (sigma-70 family)